jgi:hypothetical protein
MFCPLKEIFEVVDPEHAIIAFGTIKTIFSLETVT